jgi:hypothetical protein
MTNQLITFETAELAYSKGFDWITNDNKWYAITGELELSFQGYQENLNSYRLPVPSQSLLQRWLREVHKVDITVALVASNYGFYIHINKNTTNRGESYGIIPSYEEALEAGLFKALKLIK